MVTLKDVASRAGVSVATVSYCINGTKPVSDETRGRIMKAIEELNYVPNSAARSLRQESVREIGVVFQDLDDYYRSEILKGIVDRAEDQNYSVTVAFTYDSPKMEQKIINDFIGKNVKGIIIDTCQPDNTEYFRKNLLERKVANVFIEHCPETLDVNLLAFDNHKTYFYLTKKLLEKGYRRIALALGPWRYRPAQSAVQGYMEAYRKSGIECDARLIVYTDSSKESAFGETMKRLVKNPPQAVITASDAVLKGVMEAFYIYGFKAPDDICMVTLGEETWNRSNFYPGILHTFRSAYAMGEQCTRLLMKEMESPGLFQKEYHLLDDNLEDSWLEIPEPAPKIVPRPAAARKDVLKVLVTPYALNTTDALELLSKNFTLKTGIQVDFERCVTVRELFDRITQEAKSDDPGYDICLYDVSWLRYLSHARALKNIGELLETIPDIESRFMKKNMANCYYHDKCYGIPIIGGTQLLFYRKDLFETPEIQREFQKHHHLPLRPPKTWTEYNGIARFFTRQYNPDSPTLYGTAIEGKLQENLTLEILIRLWGFGGGLLDENGRLLLNTPQNIRGFQNILETMRYISHKPTDTTSDMVFQDFGSGNVAMIISFSEYAAQIELGVHSDIVTRIGYSQVPGQNPANVGWNLGVHPKTEKEEAICRFFDWISRRENSYYLTILSGQSASLYPYKNHDLLKLYPWLNLTKTGQDSCRSRIYPYKGKQKMVKPRELEEVLKEIFEEMQARPDKIAALLTSGQKKIQRLFA